MNEECSIKINNTTLQYSADESCDDTPSSKSKRRKIKIIWFNPPFSKNVKTNIARNFLQLIDKHFPQNISPLQDLDLQSKQREIELLVHEQHQERHF